LPTVSASAAAVPFVNVAFDSDVASGCPPRLPPPVVEDDDEEPFFPLWNLPLVEFARRVRIPPGSLAEDEDDDDVTDDDIWADNDACPDDELDNAGQSTSDVPLLQTAGRLTTPPGSEETGFETAEG
jgi:hypothetical protein